MAPRAAHDIDLHRKEPPRTGYLASWDAPETDSIVRLKDRGLMACLWFRGPDLHSALDSVLMTQATRLNALVRRFGGGWGLMTEARRRAARTYPEADWPDPVSRAIDAKRHALFTQPGHFATEMFLTLVCRTTAPLIPGWKHVLYANLPQERPDEEELERFSDEVERTEGLLNECCPAVEGEPGVVRLAGDALLTYLHSTVNMRPQQVTWPAADVHLDTFLARDDLHRLYRPPSLWRWPQLDEHWLRCVGVQAYPKATQPGMLDTLERLPLEYRAVTRYLPLDRAKAISELRKLRGAHYGQRHTTGQVMVEKFGGGESPLEDTAALDREKEVDALQAAVDHGDVSYGYPTQTVVVWDADFRRATEKAKLVEESLNTAGFTAKIETMNTMQAWEGSIPGNMYANLRRPPLHSHNLAHLIPATAPERGRSWNPHLQRPALFCATGRGHIPFWFNNYVGDVGHTLVVGPIGMGKSTLLAFMALQWRKYHGQVFVCDKGNSMRCATYAVGGHWHDMGAEVRQQFQVGISLDDPAFTPWKTSWKLGPGDWHCFEFEDLLRTPKVAAELFDALYQEILPRLTGIPTLLILDEGYIYIRHRPNFVQDALKDLRKKECSVIFTVQSLGDYAQSPIAHDINEQCLTRVFLSNYRALEPATARLYEGLAMHERQREIVAHLVPKREYYYQGYGDQGNQVFNLNLDPMTLAFVGRSRPKDLAEMDEIYWKDPAMFGVNWLLHLGLGTDAANLQEDFERMEVAV